jgi:type 1 glutamine amidotransferase
MKKIIALVGDYYHNADVSSKALNAALQPMIDNNEVELSYTTVNDFVDELTKQPDLVVLFKEDRLNPQDEIVNSWMTPAIGEAITQYVDGGGSWFAWHSGMASYDKDTAYINMLRGYFKYHPKLHQRVTYTEFNESFEILDEHYFVFCDESHTEVFLRSESIDGNSIAGWRHEYGEGKVYCLTPAHNEEALLHLKMQEQLVQAVKWCC